MRRSLKEMFGYRIKAVDGDLGKVRNFFFDDRHWCIRYLIAETDEWLSSRRVLVSTTALGTPNWNEWSFPVSLDLEQIRESPVVDADMPVSRQQELAMNAYFGWPAYWTGELQQGTQPPAGDPNLRSVREVIGYRVRAVDGTLGHVNDFIADDQDWRIRYLVIEITDWLPGKKVLVPADYVKVITWSSQDIAVTLHKGAIAGSPEYGPSQWVTRICETEIYEHYGCAPYWEDRDVLDNLADEPDDEEESVESTTPRRVPCSRSDRTS